MVSPCGKKILDIILYIEDLYYIVDFYIPISKYCTFFLIKIDWTRSTMSIHKYIQTSLRENNMIRFFL